MKKFFKTVSIVVAAVALCACAFAFSACGFVSCKGTQDEEIITYNGEYRYDSY